MKLTKAKQKELDITYNTLIQVCLYDRQLKDMEPYLADDVMNFGAGRKEITKTKAAFLKQIKNQKKLASGLKMDFRIKPVLRKITNKGNGAIYTDDIVNTVLINGVKNKLKFRLSFIFEYRGDKWIMLHSHTSTPDSQRTDDEVWPVEELKKRTAVLEKSLDEKIAELEIKNRELEIEAALERVRARTMAMHKSDELREAVRVIYEQLQHLGFDSNACNIIIIDKESGDMQYWVSGFTQEIFPEGYNVPYLSHPYHEELLAASRQNKKYDVMEYSGEMKKSFDDIFFTQTDFRKIPEQAKTFMRALKAVKLSTAFFTNGALQVLGPAELTRERVIILERFAQVFDLTYTRFRDLQKAESQAREAQIEAALERVRSRTMAMHRSEEIADILGKMFEELKRLDMVLVRVLIWIFNHEEKYISWWSANAEVESTANSYRVDYNEHPVFLACLEAWQKKVSLLLYTLSGAEKDSWQDYLFNNTGLSKLPEMVQKGMRSEGTIFTTSAISDFGLLMSGSPEPLSDENTDIILRFGRVFQQSYTRYLDVQKAEAQAREAQIQLALERVRARTMAMQYSHELAETASVLFQQLKELGFDSWATSFCIWTPNDDLLEVWGSAGDGRLQPPMMLPHKEDPPHLNIYEAHKRGETVYEEELSGEALVKHYEWMLSIPSVRETLVKLKNSGFTLPTRQYYYVAFFKQGFLNVITKEPKADAIDLNKRFAIVFEQTYTRFLDLQKAEAQAREAQVEAALERVRARTMAMQKSNELAEVVGLMHKQFEKLDFGFYQVLVSIYDVRNNVIEWWSRGFGEIELPQRNLIPIIDHPFCNDLLEQWRNGVEYYEHILEGDMKKSWDDYLFTQTDLRHFPHEVKEKMRSLESVYLADVFMKYGSLQAAGPAPLPDEKAGILKRFAKTLDLAYTRMTDLQNAEAQAREAQIEAALERVRSRTMAMQRSEELSNVATILFQQVKSLGVPQWACGFCIWDIGDTESMWYPGGPDGEILPQCRFPLTEHPVFRIMDESRKRGDELYIYEKEGEVQADHYRYMMTLPGVRELLQGMLDAGVTIPTFQIDHYANFAYGNLIFITYEHFPEMHDIFKRFAKVFEQTYTRFLDLQKAEAQAREAKIEAALEKVRSRSLAMHKSDELYEVVTVVFEKLAELDVAFDEGVAIVTFTGDSKDLTFWIASNSLETAVCFRLPYFDHPMVNVYADAAEKGIDFLDKVYSFEVKNSFYIHAFEHSDFKYLPDDYKKHILESKNISTAFALSKHSAILTVSYSGELISKQRGEVLRRFSRVFEQAYSRFLDLQKAEAQSREAQIEASLERVRTRAMAMHKSDDLKMAVATVFEELEKLNLGTLRCGIAILDRVKPRGDIWVTVKSEQENTIQLAGDEPLDYHPLLQGAYDAWLKQEDFSYVLKGEELAGYYQAVTKVSFQLPISATFDAEIKDQKQYYYNAVFQDGSLFAFLDTAFTDEAKMVVKRFANVFNLTYKRFLDLQKAEAQAREAQIEVSLERVRSKTMAMHNSQEVGDTVATMFDELVKLGVETVRCGVGILHEPNQMELWTAKKSEKEKAELIIGRLDMTIHPLLQGVYNGWKNKDITFSYDLKGKDLVDYFTVLINSPEYHIKYDIASLPQQQFHNAFYFSEGALFVFSAEQLSAEASQIFKRFAGVFGQTYRRYLDLQKAEANAREAQIEASLERVRAHAMAMHNSTDLSSTVNIFFKELKALGITPMRCGVGEMQEETRTSTLVFTTADKQGELYEIPAKLKHEGHPVVENFYNYWKLQEEYHPVLQGTEINAYYRIIKSQMTFPDFPDYTKHYGNYFYFKEGYFFAWADKELSEEGLNICRRFTSVLSLTYKRYNDLKTAEANAREAQIEAALERVRSKTMAMHKTDELQGVVRVVAEELKNTGVILDTGGAVICTYFQDSKDVIHWTATDDPAHPSVPYLLPYFKDELFDEAWASKNRRDDYFAKEFSYDVKNAFFNYAFEHSDYRQLPDEYKRIMLESKSHGLAWAWSKNSAIMIPSIQGDLPSEEEKEILVRFAKVFEQSFIRFLDLQKAETQATEAKIEAALERVRGKAMAMHSSQDLAATIGVFYHELQTFSITPRRCGVGLLNKETRLAELSTMNTTNEGESIEIIGTLRMEGHPVLEGVFNNWLLQKEYHPILRGNDIREYYQLLRPQISFPDYPNDAVQYGYFFFFNEGGVYAWTEKEMTEDELQIYRRFTTVLSLTYKRYIDLTQAEANAKEAVKQAALDRIRADIASMRTISDLDRITPLIWNELTILGVPFIRCGVFIMDNSQQLVHTFLSTPDGKAIGAFHLPYDTPGNISQVLDHWRNNKNYIDHWDESAFTELAGILVKQGAIATPDQYLSTIPHGGFYLHFLPFLQGMLYVGNTTQLAEDEIRLIQSVADAFSTAYARYEDFNKLEAAKQQVDKTLTDLKQAQTQLVQSEKMASLGELTAGIAHEIQNPLNFVNNFSDVSNELLEEMKGELATGNMQQAIAIADDVRQNLEKILHHGKRADEIVKGMLQHSRTSSGQKEPTDINALADEYLRLSYHGLRAKEKSFNAKFETDFDNSIGKINIIPQEIGRVILNLINNAFYAAPLPPEGGFKDPDYKHQPTVWLTTKRLNSMVEIRVKDNGPGIPQKILDKIFQPFFTTKPTGQGTGLGLSLSYDIVKAHGGEIIVNTKENEGTEFTIVLPA